jgi:16S rRNA processing protein RimM
VTAVVLGDLVKPIGLKGDVKLRASADFWEGALVSRQLQLWRDGNGRPVYVDSSQELGRGLWRMTFVQITDRNASESVIGSQLVIELPDDQVAAPPELRPYQVTGSRVFLKDGSLLGTVADLLHLPAQSVFVVESADKQHLIPHVPAIVVSVDLQLQEIVVDPPDGLLEL